MYSKSTKFNQIVGDIFEKIESFYFFLCELPLILGVRGKIKKMARDICVKTSDIELERNRRIGLGSTFGDRQTDRHTPTHAFFLKHFFRM